MIQAQRCICGHITEAHNLNVGVCLATPCNCCSFRDGRTPSDEYRYKPKMAPTQEPSVDVRRCLCNEGFGMNLSCPVHSPSPQHIQALTALQDSLRELVAARAEIERLKSAIANNFADLREKALQDAAEIAALRAAVGEGREIVSNLKAMVKTVPAFNNQKYDSFSIRLNKFLADTAAIRKT